MSPCHAGEHGVGGQPHVVEHELRGDRRPERELAVDIGRRETRGARRDEEATDRRRRCAPRRPTRRPPLPFVIHIFVPETIQSSPSRRARVRIAPGSLPASGSVSPKHPIASPAAIRGSHSCRCSSRAEGVDRVHRERTLHGDEAAEAAVAGLELETREAVHRGAGPRAPVPVEVHPEEAERAQLLRELAPGEHRALVPVVDLGKDPVGHPLARGVADRALLVGEQGVDADQIERLGGRDLRTGGHDEGTLPPGGSAGTGSPERREPP